MFVPTLFNGFRHPRFVSLPVLLRHLRQAIFVLSRIKYNSIITFDDI